MAKLLTKGELLNRLGIAAPQTLTALLAGVSESHGSHLIRESPERGRAGKALGGANRHNRMCTICAD
jgi:hypothetical protein